MKRLLGVFCALGVWSAAIAEVKPANTVLATYCGVNEFESAWVAQVCLARVQGFDKLDLVQTIDTKDRATAGIVVKRVEVKQNNKSLRVEKLTISTGEVEKEERYEKLVTYETTLTSKLKVIPGGGMYSQPSEINGRDANGRAFKASLQPVVHTESVGGN